MTLKYPSTGYGMSAPSAQSNVMNKLAASNNAAAGTSSWKMPTPVSFPTLKGATGNTLYPAPKTLSYPAPKATSYPSMSSYFPSATKQPGGITGGSGQAPTWNLPSSGGSSSSNPFSLLSIAGPGGTSSSPLRMPSGFSSGALGGGAPQAQPMSQPTQAPRAPQAAPVRATPTAASGQGYGMSAPSAQTNSINKQAQQNNAVNANMQKFGGPPKGAGRYATVEEAAYHSGMTNGNITGDKTMMSQHMFDTKPGTGGTYGVYPRGGSPTPAAPRPRPPATQPPVIVGRPTQTGQPVSIPVNRQPTLEEQIEQQQGGWLS